MTHKKPSAPTPAQEPGPITQSLSELPPAYVRPLKKWCVVLELPNNYSQFAVEAHLVYTTQAGALAFEKDGQVIALFSPKLWLRCDLEEPKP